MGYRKLSRVEVRVMNVGQGMGNVICGYSFAGDDIETLSFLAVVDFGCMGKKDMADKSLKELMGLMAERAESERKYRQKIRVNGVKIDISNVYYLLDIFVLSHNDYDHYSLLKSILQPVNIKNSTNGVTDEHICSSNKQLINTDNSNLYLCEIESEDYFYFAVYRLNDEIPIFRRAIYEDEFFFAETENCFKILSQKHTETIGYGFLNSCLYNDIVEIECLLIHNDIHANINIIINIHYSINDEGVFKMFYCNATIKEIQLNNNIKFEVHCGYYRRYDDLLLFHFNYEYEIIPFDADSIFIEWLNIINEAAKSGSVPDDVFPFFNDIFSDETIINELLNTFYSSEYKINPDAFNAIFLTNDRLKNDNELKILNFIMQRFQETNATNKKFQVVACNSGTEFNNENNNFPENLDFGLITPMNLETLPPEANSWLYFDEKNTRSIQLLVTFTNPDSKKEEKFLFPGDATVKTMYEFYNEHSDCPTELKLMCAPHHGSDITSTGYLFVQYEDDEEAHDVLFEYLKLCNPQYHIISSGYKNPYLHPGRVYIDCAQQRGTHQKKKMEQHFIYCAKDSELPFFEIFEPIFTTVTLDENNWPIYISYKYDSSVNDFISYTPGGNVSPTAFKISNHKKASLQLTPFTFEHRGGTLWQ